MKSIFIRAGLSVIVACVMLTACTASGKNKRIQTNPNGAEATAVARDNARVKRTRRMVRPRQQLPIVEEVKLPETFKPKMPGVRVAQVSVPGRYVALTFDDGPSASLTPQVLNILRRYNAKATFFVLGENAVRNKSILVRAVAEGHEIGSHTWSHIQLTRSSTEKIQREMDRTNEVIRDVIGHNPVIMRPPYGATNSSIQNMMMQRYGMPSILWDVDTQDWKHPGVSVVIHRAVSRAHSGSIILLHDIHASTLAAVEGVVRGLQERGFTLVTVSELMEMGRRAASGSESAAEPTAPGNSLPPAEPPTPQPEPQIAAVAAAGADNSPSPAPEVRPEAVPYTEEQPASSVVPSAGAEAQEAAGAENPQY